VPARKVALRDGQLDGRRGAVGPIRGPQEGRAPGPLLSVTAKWTPPAPRSERRRPLLMEPMDRDGTPAGCWSRPTPPESHRRRARAGTHRRDGCQTYWAAFHLERAHEPRLRGRKDVLRGGLRPTSTATCQEPASATPRFLINGQQVGGGHRRLPGRQRERHQAFWGVTSAPGDTDKAVDMATSHGGGSSARARQPYGRWR